MAGGFSIEHLGGQARTFAAPIQAEGVELGFHFLVVGGRIAILINAVETHTELLVLAKATANVKVPAKLRIRQVSGGHTHQRFGTGALG